MLSLNTFSKILLEILGKKLTISIEEILLIVITVSLILEQAVYESLFLNRLGAILRLKSKSDSLLKNMFRCTTPSSGVFVDFQQE